ncbi:hypothetical protein AKJ51_02130 [candidate division MSBL1 archaeon SCGC-AAA382A20]|uniref:Uncharacterized protein n=1 Tax=candidate division MSBL1 archaeon SCGC-AAA382A20 TaxID=1698280 RepID=A0A133VKU9_9EURY|nr:hypothetical protein AKJ51_02130 [candidate division MSBL1 archaeon SCGC-AAA382A20]
MMNNQPDWLPELVRLKDYEGKWGTYVEVLYEIFRKDFKDSRPQFRSSDVACQTNPLHQGKEPAFWHLIQGDGAGRKPDMRRCERIGWPRAILENANSPKIRIWETQRGKDNRWCLWYVEEYLVVLGERSSYYFLITAYPTNIDHTCQKLRKDYERSL